MNMCPSDPRASPNRYHPCTSLQDCYQPHTWFFSSALRGPLHMLSSPSVNIFWIMTLPALLYIILRHVRRLFRSIRSHVAFQPSDDPQRRDDRLLCKVFPASLKGPALGLVPQAFKRVNKLIRGVMGRARLPVFVLSQAERAY